MLRAITFVFLGDSSRFLKIPLSDLYAGCVGRLGPPGPPCFLFFVSPLPPGPL